MRRLVFMVLGLVCGIAAVRVYNTAFRNNSWKGQLAAIKSELRNLDEAQKRYKTAHGTYAESLDSLGLSPREDVRLKMLDATTSAYHAEGRHSAFAETAVCAISSETEVVCTGFVGMMGRPRLARAAPPGSIRSIAYTIVPLGLGSAEVEYWPDGKIRGNHLSGDSVPLVHQADGHLDSAKTARLFNLVHLLRDSILIRADTVPAGGRGYERLQINWEGRAPTLLVWPAGTENADPGVRVLIQQMLEHRVGGW